MFTFLTTEVLTSKKNYDYILRKILAIQTKKNLVPTGE